MSKPRILVLGEPAGGLTAVKRSLGELTEDVQVVQVVDQAVSAYEQGKAHPALVLVAATSAGPGKALEAVQLLRGRGAKTVLLGESKDPDLILQALRAGASEFVLADDEHDLRRAVRALVEVDSSHALGRIVSVFPTKGGVGATTVAINLAGALARRGQRVCLIDLDLHFGDVLSFLDLPSKYSIAELIANMQRLDRELLDASVTCHPSGLYVLAQNDKPEEAERIKPSDITALLAFARRHYDVIVIDGLEGFDDHTLCALDATHLVLLLLTQDVPAVRSVQRFMALFRRLGYEDSRVRLILNRYDKSSKVSVDIISEVAELPIAGLVRNDFASLIQAINRGVMLFDEAPRSKLARDIESLASLVHGKPATAKRGFWPQLFS